MKRGRFTKIGFERSDAASALNSIAAGSELPRLVFTGGIIDKNVGPAARQSLQTRRSLRSALRYGTGLEQLTSGSEAIESK
jgi:hypothetical protein